MAAKLGTNGFQIVYSVISLGTFFWMIKAYEGVPDSSPLWAVGDGIWGVASILILFGSILFAGSLFGNRALPQPNAQALASAPARGVLAITRHPMMWGFALWALVHVLVSPMTNVILLCAGMAFLALVGAAGQDRKKAVLMGEGWKDWTSRTSFLPFGNQLSGKASWATAWPGRTVVLAGTILWLVATYNHAPFGIRDAGIWRWVWG